MIFSNLLLVGVGGFFGAIARYAAGLAVNGIVSTPFPAATLLINVSGSFLLGLLAAQTIKNGLPESVFLLLGIGFFGAFTTFSTFSVEAVELFKVGRTFLCALYIVISPTTAVLAAFIGLKI
jgi:CrcB protein